MLRADGKEIRIRIVSPKGYARVNVKEGFFGEYLRNIPLRSHGAEVYYFDQVLVNLKERDKSPWYTLKGEGSILTPEWGFTSADLKRFKD